MIHIVFRNGQLALYQIVEFELILDGTGGFEAQNPGITSCNLSLDFLNIAVTPDGIFAVIAGGFFVCFLLLTHGCQFFLSGEAGICLSLGNQLLGIYMIDGSSLTLAVRTVSTVVTGVGSTLVKENVVMLQRVNQNFHSAGNFTLGVGIFYAQKQHTAALVGHTFRNHTLNQVAQMDKAGGRGGHTGNHSSFGNITQWETLLQCFRGVCYIGKQKISQCLIIHNITSFSFIILARL